MASGHDNLQGVGAVTWAGKKPAFRLCETSVIRPREADSIPKFRIFAFSHLLLIIFFFGHPAAFTSQQPVVQVSGTVVDANGSAIKQAHVYLQTKHRVLSQLTTDERGEFLISTSETNNVTLVIRSEGFSPYELLLTGSQSGIRVVLVPSAISEQVTVTAARTETRLSETAASVVSLNKEDLSTTAAPTLDDALRQVAGFNLFRRSGSRTANPTSQGVSLRGIGASGASRALVIADGIPLNDPFGGWVYWNRLPRESITQVEVLLGGASYLYGSTAMGGVVNIATRRPEENTLVVTAAYGNEATPNASAYAAMHRGRWAGDIATEVFKTDGYIPVAEAERGSIDTPAASRFSTLNARLERSFGENKRLFGRASFFGEARKNGTPLQTNRTHIRQFVLGGDWSSRTIGEMTARGYGGTQVLDQFFSAVSSDRNSESLTRVQRVPAQSTGLSFNWSRALGPGQTVVAGVETQEVRGASDEIAYLNNRATSFVTAGGRERTTGVYLEDLIKLRSRVFLTFGVRFDRWRNYAAASASRPITNAIPNNITVFPDRDEIAFSPHASVVVKATNQLSFMGSVFRAFRAPTLNELYRSFRVGNVLTLANENLRAERLTGTEAGARLTSKNQRWVLRGTLFWNVVDRPVSNVTLQTTPVLITRQRQNLGNTRSRGVELQSEAAVNQFWTVTAGYLFADATVLRFPANPAIEGLSLPQVARHQFTFQTRYSNPSKLTIAVQGRASSSQFDDDQNLFRLDPYFVLDVFASRRLRRSVELFVAVENVLNERYEIGKTPVTTVGPPLLLRGGIKMMLGAK